MQIVIFINFYFIRYLSGIYLCLCFFSYHFDYKKANLPPKKNMLKRVLSDNFFAIIPTGIGGILYYFCLKGISFVTKIALENTTYNSVSNAWTNKESIINRIISAYTQFVDAFVNMKGYAYSNDLIGVFNIIVFAIGVISFVCILVKLCKEKGKRVDAIAAVICICILPLGMNAMRLLSTIVHYLMIYAFWLSYIFAFMFFLQLKETMHVKYIEKCLLFVLGVILLTNVQASNAAYVKKTTEQQATLSVMTRVINDIENLNGYEPGVTPVAFISLPGAYINYYDPFRKMSDITGLGTNSVITYYNIYEYYFDMILRVDINIVDLESALYLADQEQIRKMPSYPNKESIKIVDGIVIVKWE